MDKRDIYEHLAKIYLDASSKREKKTKRQPLVFKNLFFLVTVFILGFSIFLVTTNRFDKNKLLNKPLNSEIALILQNNVTKINFNFDVAKKEVYSIDLNKLDLSRFKALGFSVRKANYQDDATLKVEFNTSFREKSEIYLKDIPAYKWQDYKITLSEFKNISDWSETLNLSFIIEEWNIKQKKGIVYIDNVRLLR